MACADFQNNAVGRGGRLFKQAFCVRRTHNRRATGGGILGRDAVAAVLDADAIKGWHGDLPAQFCDATLSEATEAGVGFI